MQGGWCDGRSRSGEDEVGCRWAGRRWKIREELKRSLTEISRKTGSKADHSNHDFNVHLGQKFWFGSCGSQQLKIWHYI